jgi:hypothetical protein
MPQRLNPSRNDAREDVSWLWTLAVTLAVLCLLALAGCGKSEDAKSAASAPPARGEPIAPAKPTTNVSTTAPASVAMADKDQTSTNNPAPATQDGFAVVGFEKLSGYNIEVPDDLLGPLTNDAAAAAAKTDAMIPEPVRALDKTRVSLKGFMLPLKVEGGLVTELLIMKDQSMCCYGSTPKLNEWVSIKMTGAGVKAIMDQPVTLFGKLHVGEMRENGYLVGIYKMDGEKMQGPEE